MGRFPSRYLIAVTLLVGSGSALLPAQAPGRIATTSHALLASPAFFHGRQVALRAPVAVEGQVTRLDVPLLVDPATQKAPRQQVFVLWKEPPSRNEGEIRGEFWDLGRLSEDDGRFTSLDFRPILERATKGRWPGRDEVFVVLGATLLEAPLPPSPTLRAIAMAPEAYENRPVTVSGRFRGRNLYGDLPGPINKSRWDFVLHSADGAVWVSGLRPKGRNFDLDAGARVDTGRWLQVSGTVRLEGHTVWIEAQSIDLATAPTEMPVEVDVPVRPREPPPSVIFSAPVSDDVDVERSARVRVQFSRDMNPKTFEGHVRVSYVSSSGAAPPPVPPFSVAYNPGNRGIEIRFAKPLERFATIRIELLEGITATDGQPLEPWTLTFLTGGS